MAQALNAAGYRTNGNRGANPFSKDTVRVILQNRFYLGELPEGRRAGPGKHEAVIDPALFERAPGGAAANTKRPIGPRRPPAVGALRASRPAAGAARRWWPTAARAGGAPAVRRPHQGNGCTEPSYLAHMVEDQLTDLSGSSRSPNGEGRPCSGGLVAAPKRGDEHGATRKRLEGRHARVKELYLGGGDGPAEYGNRKAAVEAEIAALPTGAAQTTGMPAAPGGIPGGRGGGVDGGDAGGAQPAGAATVRAGHDGEPDGGGGQAAAGPAALLRGDRPEKQRCRSRRIRIGIETRVSNRCEPQPPNGCQVSQGMVHRRK